MLESIAKKLEAGEPVIQTGHYMCATILLLDGLLNVYREVISRLLKKLEQTGTLTLYRNYLEVHKLVLV